MTLPELIAALEKSQGPSRDLDAGIGRAIGFVPKRKNINKRSRYPTVVLRVEEVFPAYTSSLDAALTLVPEGWFWWVGHLDETDRRFVATIAKRAVVGSPSCKGLATTAPIAICIAALQARLQARE